MSGTFELDGGFSNSSGNTEHTKKVDGTLTERDYVRTNSSSNSMTVDVEAAGDDWDFELHANSSNGHNRTVVGTLTTETASGSRHSSSSTGWVLLIHTASGTITISYDTSTSTNTGGSAVKLADDTFGTYLFQRDIDANGNGTSSWSGTQAKRTETSYDWIDTGTDDETHSDSVTTLDIDDDWTYSETEYHETSQTGGVPNDPYNFTTQDTYETTNETQRETAEDTPNPFNADNHLNGSMATASGAVNQHTNSNATGFGNAGTGSGSVQASGSSTTGESVPETGTLPNGNTYEKYDDGNYWYYKEWDEGILVIDESGYHETGSINMPLSAGQNAATSAEEDVPNPEVIVTKDYLVGYELGSYIPPDYLSDEYAIFQTMLATGEELTESGEAVFLVQAPIDLKRAMERRRAMEREAGLREEVTPGWKSVREGLDLLEGGAVLTDEIGSQVPGLAVEAIIPLPIPVGKGYKAVKATAKGGWSYVKRFGRWVKSFFKAVPENVIIKDAAGTIVKELTEDEAMKLATRLLGRPPKNLDEAVGAIQGFNDEIVGLYSKGLIKTNPADDVIKASAEYFAHKQQNKLDDLINQSKKGRATKGSTKQYERTGGFTQATQDFDSLNLDQITTHSNGMKSGKMADGRTVILRPQAGGQMPTLEFQNIVKNRVNKRIKFRYP